MAQAVYALWRITESVSGVVAVDESEVFKNLIMEIKQCGGDTMSNCALSGALMGCRIGYNNLPKTWLSKIDHEFFNVLIVKYLQHLGFTDSSNKSIDEILQDLSSQTESKKLNIASPYNADSDSESHENTEPEPNQTTTQ
jgi:hypothetical protein